LAGDGGDFKNLRIGYVVLPSQSSSLARQSQTHGKHSVNRKREQHMKRAVIVSFVAVAIALAAPVRADPDADFANELHTYGIYGQKDYNAWIGKIVCKRLYSGVDQDADKSAQFVFNNLQIGSTTEQSWQFLGASLRTYCPDLLPVLARAAAH
jgi:beta-glucanase (GH16 family)